ncbi:hypothetical protein [Synechocystis sp. LKSZ1]|uniref:AZOBR_p60025 family cell surface glycopolymer formation protein n=1 Tax=Synechocystis sp. LKSZ1 TaxID=3144951 RepID=UPI00336BDB40
MPLMRFMDDYRKSRQAALANAVLAFLLASLVCLFLYFGKFEGNITGFFRIGSVLPLSPLLQPETTRIWPDELGYDGQQFLSISLDPFLTQPGTIAALDQPSYRYRRILYPLLGYFLGLGNPCWIPYGLVGLNILAITAFIFLLTRSLQIQDQSPENGLWGLAIPGVWMVLSLSTADLWASVLALAALLSFQSRRPWGMGWALALGLLTRETLLLVWLALVIASVRSQRREHFLPLGLALLPFLLWNAWIIYLSLPGASGTGNFTWPVGGLLAKGEALLQNGLTLGNLYEAYSFSILGLTLAWGLRNSLCPRPQINALTLTFWSYAGLGAVASFYILNYYLNYSRVFLDLYWLFLLLPCFRPSMISLDSRPGMLKNLLCLGWGLASLAFILLQS